MIGKDRIKSGLSEKALRTLDISESLIKGNYFADE